MSEIQHADWEEAVRAGKAPLRPHERGSQPWWDSVPDPDDPRHHEGCSDDCEYKVHRPLSPQELAYIDKVAALRPVAPPSRSALAWAWVKGFGEAMSEIKLSDWQKSLRKGDVELVTEQGRRPLALAVSGAKPHKLTVVFTDDGEAWTPVYEAKTGSGPYRSRQVGLRRITPDEAALIATHAADRSRRFMTFALGLTTMNVLIQVLRLIFG